MTTVAIVPAVPLWTRVRTHLNNWGTKVVGFFKKVGDWFVKGAKWLINTPPVRWTVTKTKFVAGWLGFRAAVAWHYVSRPLLWIGLPTFAIWAMPTTTMVLLGLVVLALAGITFFTYRGYRHITTISSHEELVALVDRVIEEPVVGSTELSFDDDVLPGETVQNRLVFLDQQLSLAQQAEDSDKYSEIVARMNLINVRQGEVKGIRSNESLTKIHQACRKQCETDYPTFAWNWDLMYRGTLSEGRRLKEQQKLLAKGPVPVK